MPPPDLSALLEKSIIFCIILFSKVFFGLYTTVIPSLNDCLETVPNLLLQIIDILVTFRCYRIGLIGDIQTAFLHGGIALDDVLGSTASQFLMNAVIQKHLLTNNDIDSEFVIKVLHEIYVDDLISGGKDVVSTYQFFRNCKNRFLEAGLNIRKWFTNDFTLDRMIDSTERSKDKMYSAMKLMF